jgi:hypothetical protein
MRTQCAHLPPEIVAASLGSFGCISIRINLRFSATRSSKYLPQAINAIEMQGAWQSILACFRGAVACGTVVVHSADVWIGLLDLARKVRHVSCMAVIDETRLFFCETASKRQGNATHANTVEVDGDFVTRHSLMCICVRKRRELGNGHELIVSMNRLQHDIFPIDV